MTKMRKPYPILYLHHTGNFSGAENSLLHLAINLDHSKFKPIFLCPGRGEFPARLKKNTIKIISQEFGRLREINKVLKSILTIKSVAIKNRIKLLHSNGPQTNIPSGIVGRMLKIPVIWHARNLLKPDMIDIDKLFRVLPNKIICNSEAIRSRFSNNVSNDGKCTKSTTIINSVNLKDYYPGETKDIIRHELGIPSNAIVLGMTSRLASDKGHDIFLEALSEIIKNNSQVWGLVGGDNVFPEDDWVPDYLKRKAKNLGIADKVIFTGFRRDIIQIYDAMDIFILGSDAEPCGRVLFEAMAMAKPVIATESGGTPEIVVDGITGFLYKPGDVVDLTKKIHKLLDSDKLNISMGLAGRKRVEEKYNIETYIERTQEEYLNLLEGNCADRN